MRPLGSSKTHGYVFTNATWGAGRGREKTIVLNEARRASGEGGEMTLECYDINCKNCWECLDRPELGIANPTVCRMILCAKCGNKRCPKANSHFNDCTNSNEPGQPGSAYK